MNNIKQYLDKNMGFTQTAVIELLKSRFDIEVKKSMMSSYCHNRNQPTLSLIKRISEVMGVSLEKLIK